MGRLNGRPTSSFFGVDSVIIGRRRMRFKILLAFLCLFCGFIWAQDSLNCRLVGGWPFGPSYAVAVDEARNIAFLGSGGGVYILNVANPSNPVKISEAIHTKDRVEGLFYQSNKLYIAPGDEGLEIWDVADPSSPQKLGSCNTPGYACGVAVSDNYVYVADYYNPGLRVIDIAVPQNPREVGYCETPSYTYGVAIAGNYVYLACWDSGLRVIDVSNPAHPLEVGSYNTPGVAKVVVSANNYAYVADGDSGLRVVDVSDHTNPGEVSHFNTSGYARSVDILWKLYLCV